MTINFSIITVTYNSKPDLLKTISSIQNQNYENFIHIIKDGLSKDKTDQIVFSNLKNVIFISKKDLGIYDAMNQALEYAENEYIIFLNSGDTFFSNNVLRKLSQKIENNLEYYAYSGGTVQIDPVARTVKRIIGISFLYKVLPLAQLPHPSFVIKKSILSKLKTPFDPNLEIASDYIQQLVLRKENLWKVCYLKQILSIMPLGGKSNKGKSSIIKGYLETFKNSFKLFKFFAFYVIILKLILNLYSQIYIYKFKKFKNQIRTNGKYF